MDLRPFNGINPCGYAGLKVTQLADLGIILSVEQAGLKLAASLAAEFGYADIVPAHWRGGAALAGDSEVA
jgi:lipoyl(octanoyl) transferase